MDVEGHKRMYGVIILSNEGIVSLLYLEKNYIYIYVIYNMAGEINFAKSILFQHVNDRLLPT